MYQLIHSLYAAPLGQAIRIFMTVFKDPYQLWLPGAGGARSKA
jgi:hypothetical protein